MNEVEGFDKNDYQLGKLQLAEMGGFLFIAPDTDKVKSAVFCLHSPPE